MKLLYAGCLHTSWFIAWFAAAAICGIALTGFTPLRLHGDVWIITATIAFLLPAAARHQRVFVITVAAAGLVAGIGRGSFEQYSLLGYRAFFGTSVQIQGTVSEDTSYGPHGDQRILLKDVTIKGQSLPGKIWISSTSQVNIKRSDRLAVSGKIGAGFGSIAASMFHARIVNVSRSDRSDIGLQARDWFASGIRTSIPEPQASLAAGYLIGQRSALPEEIDSQLKIVGLTHAVVASGYNLTILVGFARQLLLGVSKYLATLSAAGMIIAFIMMSGLSPSMTRAGLVTSLSLAAWYYGRKIHPAVLLLSVAAATALINPAYVWGDIGWYLSFTSFAGVIILAPVVRHYFWGTRAHIGIIPELIIDTTSAQIATLPIMIFTFGHYSPYAILANLLVLPLVPAVMALTCIAGLFGIALPAAAHLVGLPATLILQYMTKVIEIIANLPGAQGDLTISVAWLAASYAILGVIVILLYRKTGHNFRRSDLATQDEPLLQT